MKRVHFRWVVLLFCGLLHNASVHAQVPHLISYQGRLSVAGSNFDGVGQFKFALVDHGTNIYWGNSNLGGSPPAPGAAVSLNVGQGLFTVLLGDTNIANMAAIPAAIFTNADVRLRIWFDDGTNGFARLAPDQRFAAVAYAFMAGTVPDGAITDAQLASGAVTSSKIAEGAIGSAQLGVNSVQSSNIAPGAIGSVQLAKPPRSGTLNSNSLLISFDEAVFTVPFSPPFTTTPLVTLTSQSTSDDVANGSILTVLSNSAASFTGKWWMPKVPETVAHNAGSCSLAALLGGHPAIAYESFESGGFRCAYIRAYLPPGVSWSTFRPVIVDGAESREPFLAIVNGNPAISYRYYNTNTGQSDLRYVRASDSDGSSWGAPVSVDIAPPGALGVSSQSALTVLASGFPAICYYTRTPTNALRFTRAMDANGTTWASPFTLDASVGGWLSLAVINGHPAVSYVSDGQLKFIRAQDTNGTAWNSPVAVVDTAVAPLHTSLALVNGSPAIAYTTFSFASGLRYVRANDTNGSTWGAPIAVGHDSNTGSSSLKVINGVPAISYSGGHHLKFVRAADPNGTIWSRPAILDTMESTFFFRTSLALVHNRPAVAYKDGLDATIKFVLPRFSGTPPLTIVWMALEP